MFVSESMLSQFKYYLEAEEKSEHTISKYCRDVHRFILYASDGELTKQLIIHYKETLLQQGYAFSSINSMLASINAFLSFLGLDQMKVRTVKMQREIFYPEEKNLTHTEYSRLLQQALRQGKRRLYLLMQTIYATGIRVSELPYITVEAAKRGYAIVDCKGKTRKVVIISGLCRKLLSYATQHSIQSGPIFVTRNGKPLSRSNIWRDLKALCIDTDVSPSKVFPYNLRHLFARCFYDHYKDIAKLADILGHASINTTRIYIKTSYHEHLSILEEMNLLE